MTYLCGFGDCTEDRNLPILLTDRSADPQERPRFCSHAHAIGWLMSKANGARESALLAIQGIVQITSTDHFGRERVREFPKGSTYLKMGERDPMMVEYSAWQRIVRHWHEHTGDINADNSLADAIKAWGEELVALRISQTAEVRERAREMNCKQETL